MPALLVLTPKTLPSHISQTLTNAGWTHVVAADWRQAADAMLAHRISVGLAWLAGVADAGRLESLQRAVETLAGLRWVAALNRRQVSEAPIRQLILKRLHAYVLDPVEPQRLCCALEHAHAMAQIEEDLPQPPRMEAAGRFGMIDTDAAMRSLYAAIDRAAGTDAGVLIMGPTGTGKELVARAVHGRSARAEGPFVSLNCAAIPPALVQSELFGHRRGAFTGASASRPGLIETAAGGSLFLDEIGEMPLESQSSLLRFLDDRRLHPLGAEQSVDVDVRIIAATNRDLTTAAQSGRFRADLFYRLSVLTLRTPALKDLGADIEQLALHLLREARQRFGAAPAGFSPQALAALRRHAWPGNVRELRSRIYQAAIQSKGGLLEPAELELAPPDVAPDALSNIGSAQGAADTAGGDAGAPRALNAIRDQAERDAIEAALVRNAQNVRQAAAELEVSRMTLYRLMKKHGLTPAGAEAPPGDPD